MEKELSTLDQYLTDPSWIMSILSIYRSGPENLNISMSSKMA